jgi:hypothetical protein
MLHICIVSGGSGGRFSSNSSGELDEMGGLRLAAGRDKGVFWPRMAAAIFSPVQSTVVPQVFRFRRHGWRIRKEHDEDNKIDY